MKKFVVLLIATVFVLVACSPSGEITSNTSEQTKETSTTQMTTTTANSVVSLPEKSKEITDLEKVSEQIELNYDKFVDYHYNYAFLYITNNSNMTIDYELSVDFYDVNGELVGVSSVNEQALEPNVTYASYVMNDIEFEYIECKISLNESYYYGVVSNLGLDVKTLSEKAIISVTNNGDITAEFVKYNAIFYKGNEIVGHDWGYTVDSNSQIAKGKTERTEASIYGTEFDRVKVYLSGRSPW